MGEPADSVQPAPLVKAGTWVYMEQIELQEFIKESRAFQLAISKDMAYVTGQLPIIVGRLDKINGTVGRHEQELNLLRMSNTVEAAVAKATQEAEARGALALKAANDRTEQLQKESAEKFRKWFQPSIEKVVTMVGVALATYMLTHGQELAKLITGK